MNQLYIDLAIEAALEAKKEEEIPIGAVIVKNDEVVAIAHNLKEQLQCATKHAEIIAIELASKKLKSWRLNGCDMYVTMEPCIMCCGALIQSRIHKVYYLLDNQKFGGTSCIKKILQDESYNHCVEFEKIKNDELEQKMQEILSDFFSNKR